MKKVLFFTMMSLLICSMSCNNEKTESGMSDKAKKNLETAQALTKMFETGDWSKTGDYIATDAVDHAGMKGDVVGLDSIKAEFAVFSKTMSDMKNEPVKEMADDDYVFQWMKESWTMKEDGMGMKAGQKGNADAIEVSKMQDGKVKEHWSFISYTDMMKMMSSQPPAMDNKMMDSKKDTTKKM
jgi:predicted SnoaL-like aldol condensation-catalyzing enzyme